MGNKKAFPQPEDVSFLLLDREKGEAVPVDSLPEKEWEQFRGQIMLNVGRGISEILARRNTRDA